MRDLVSNIGFAVAIPAAVYAADSTPGAVDLLGFNSALVELHVGVGGITFTGANKIEFVLSHSDDDQTYDPVTIDDVQGLDAVSNGIVHALTGAHAAADIVKIGYVGNRRYVNLLANFSGTHGTGTAIAASIVKSDATTWPIA